MIHSPIKVFYTFTELFTDGFKLKWMLVLYEFNSFALPLNFISHLSEYSLMAFILIQCCLHLI